jgi:bacteriorhodopsin
MPDDPKPTADNPMNVAASYQPLLPEFQTEIYKNLNLEVIQITADKAKLILTDWRRKIHWQWSWSTPLAIFLSLLLTLTTTTGYKDALSVSKDVWAAFYLLLTLASVVWLLWTIVYICRNRAESVENIVNKFKNVKSETIHKR